MKKKTRRSLLKLLAGILLVCGLGIYTYQQYGDYNLFLKFDVVEQGKLLRSAQPHIGDIRRIHEEYNLGTIFVLYGTEEGDIKEYAREQGINVIGISIPGGGVPNEKQMDLWFKLMSGKSIKWTSYSDILAEWPDENVGKMRFPFPVLMHCRAGSDRSGVMVALYRMRFQGWSKDEAKKEMRKYFHFPIFNPKPFELIDEFKT